MTTVTEAPSDPSAEPAGRAPSGTVKAHELWRGHPAVRTGDQLTRGERAADIMKRTLATWVALIIVLCFIVSWMLYNSHVRSSGHHFDPYPWILLNLFLSCYAALQCFVLLIANKRGEQIAAEIAVHTEKNTDRIKVLLDENTALTREVERNTSMTDEVHRHVTAITRAMNLDVGVFEPDPPAPAGD
jgi:uncharacterized membrane protein